MRCPKCSSDDSGVTDSRHVYGNHYLRRRRKCKSCGYKFSTYEVPETEFNQDKMQELEERIERIEGLLAI